LGKALGIQLNSGKLKMVQEARKELESALGYNKAHPAALKNLELVARMEGRKAPAPPAALGARSGWSRFLARLKGLFVGPLDKSESSKGGAVATASNR